ncbi:response regulator [Patescibacteria group bacterium]|nr:response regulator [Patescibacteria group bacterium]MCH8889420.1 response regulator [Patescibacteria group bacterium]
MNEKLLLVEESPYLRGILKDILQRRGYALTTVESLKETKAKLVESDASYDALVLVTEKKPELVEFVRKSRKFQFIPVIMISGEKAYKNAAKELKTLFLRRPFGIYDFDTFIESARELVEEFEYT